MTQSLETTAAAPERPIVVQIRDGSKRFVLRKDKSIKDRLLHPRQSKHHEDDFWALKDIDLDVYAGTTIGLIGPNGSGKSTLLKVIGGIIESNSGTVITRGRIAPLLELGAGFHPDLTGRENVYLNAAILGMTRAETEAQFDDIVAFSGIEQFIDTQVKFYSSGMYVRLAFSVAVHVDPDIILVDEVLAVGDEAFQQKCLDKIEDFQAEGRTIIIVSHAMGQVTALCDRAIVLQHGEVAFDGDPAEAVTVLRAGLAGAELEGGVSVQTGAVESMAPAEILEVTPVVPNGDTLQPGDSLQVDVRFRVSEPADVWDLTVNLVNPLGSTVLATAARVVGLGLSRIEGEQHISFTLPHLWLSQGGYSLTVAYFDHRHREVCKAEGVGGFKVEVAGEQSIGTIYSPVSATLDAA